MKHRVYIQSVAALFFVFSLSGMKREHESEANNSNKQSRLATLLTAHAARINQGQLPEPPEPREPRRIRSSQQNDNAVSSSESAGPSLIQGAKYTWVMPPEDEARVAHIMEKFSFSRIAAQTLVTRGFQSDTAIEKFINPTRQDNVHEPMLLKDGDKAIARIEQAIEKKEKILICGDYDVDGMSSSTLLIKCLRPLGALIDYHIPNRMKDGYGLKSHVITKAAQDGYKVVITVDNGITAFDPAIEAKKQNIDLIITDHHLAHGQLPDAYALVNPNQPDCPYPFKSLAGVGVAFKLMCGLYEKRKLTLPDKAYEMMMLGTIADVVPLQGENRFWVRHGLDLVNRTGGSASYKKLIRNSKLNNPTLNSINIAFNITPQLNAIGRLGDANKGVKFLLDESEATIEEIGDELAEINAMRKKVQGKIFDQAKKHVQNNRIHFQNGVIVASSSEWHPGINGLVASKLVDKYFMPAFLFHETTNASGEKILKGSCRSIPGLNIFEGLKVCEDLLEKFGGHAMAGGMSLKQENLPKFVEKLSTWIKQQGVSAPRSFQIDSTIHLRDLNPSMIEDLKNLEPFGSENPQPAFMVEASAPQLPTFMGRKHVRCELIAQGVSRQSTWFFRPDMYFKVKEIEGDDVYFIGNPNDNYYTGERTVELNGIDIEKFELESIDDDCDD